MDLADAILFCGPHRVRINAQEPSEENLAHPQQTTHTMHVLGSVGAAGEHRFVGADADLFSLWTSGLHGLDRLAQPTIFDAAGDNFSTREDRSLADLLLRLFPLSLIFPSTAFAIACRRILSNWSALLALNRMIFEFFPVLFGMISRNRMSIDGPRYLLALFRRWRPGQRFRTPEIRIVSPQAFPVASKGGNRRNIGHFSGTTIHSVAPLFRSRRVQCRRFILTEWYIPQDTFRQCPRNSKVIKFSGRSRRSK